MMSAHGHRHKRHSAGTTDSGPIVFELPSQPLAAVILGGWGLLAHFAIAQSETALTGRIFWYIPQGVFRFGLWALAAVHVFEAAVMYLACRHVQRDRGVHMAWATQVQYTLSTLVFGIFAGNVLCRQLARRGIM